MRRVKAKDALAYGFSINGVADGRAKVQATLARPTDAARPGAVPLHSRWAVRRAARPGCDRMWDHMVRVTIGLSECSRKCALLRKRKRHVFWF